MAGKNSIQILRGGPNYDPLISEAVLSDGQPFYSKKTKQLYIGENNKQIQDLQPVSSNLYGDPAGEECVSQLSHNAVNTEGGDNILDPLQANITTGRSSFTNGQGNRNGGYYGIQTGQNNIQPRLFDMTFPDSSVVKKWRSASSNIVGGLGNFVTSANSVVSGYTNQSAGSLSIISGRNNKDWVEGATPEESEKTQNSITAYKNYSLYGANENTGEIYDKNGAGTDAYLQDIQFNPLQTFTIMNGLANNNRSIYSIMNGSGNKNFANTSIIVGKNNNANTTDYSYDAGSKCHFIFGSSNTTQGSNIYSLGNSNTLSGNNIIALGRDCISSDFNNVILMNSATATRSNQVVIGGSNPADWAKFSIGGGSSTAFQVSDSNYVYVTRKPIDDNNPIRLIDIGSGDFSGSFSSLKSGGSKVVTLSDMSSTNTFKTYTPTFKGLQLRRSSDEVKLDSFSALRLADISTHYQGKQLNTGAEYQALDVKFARIKMKATPGNDGGSANTGNGSTVILPDKITTNEINIKNITGTIDTLTTDDKNIIGAINELKIETSSIIKEYEHQIIFEFVGLDEEAVTILDGSHGRITINAPIKTAFTSYEEIKQYLKLGQKIDWLMFEDGSLADTDEAYWEIIEINDNNFIVDDGEGTILTVAMANISDIVVPAGVGAVPVEIDKTLTINGMAADAKVVGDTFKNCVKNTDIATGAKAGISKVQASAGIGINNQTLYLAYAGKSEIDEKTSGRAIVPSTLDYAVKVGVTTNTETLTDDEKATACDWLGTVKKLNNTSAASLPQAYLVDKNNNTILLEVTEWGASPYTIPKRDNRGAIAVATPSGNNDATNKKYVDDLVASTVKTAPDNRNVVKAYCVGTSGEELLTTIATSPIVASVGSIPTYMAETYGDTSPNSWLLSKTPTKDYHCANKKYVDERLNGANKAVSFVNYSSMITSLNNLSNSAYNIGQNIMIVTLNVPDLWVSEIIEETVSYEYISDDDFVSLLSTQGYVQVGYYKLSALETQKVDLTDYTKNTDVASTTKLGLVKGAVGNGNGIQIDGDGTLKILGASKSVIESKGSNTLPLTPYWLDTIFKVGMTTNTTTLTDEEKTAALDWLGAVGKDTYPTNSSTRAGVVRIDTYYGLEIGTAGSNGVIKPIWATNSMIDNRTTNRPIGTDKLDYAVLSALTTNKKTMTDEQKATACEWLGASGKLYVHSITFTSNNNGDFNFTVVSKQSTPYTYNTMPNFRKIISIDKVIHLPFRGDFYLIDNIYNSGLHVTRITQEDDLMIVAVENEATYNGDGEEIPFEMYDTVYEL